MLFTVAPSSVAQVADGTSAIQSGAVDVGVDYSGFAQAEGGNFAARLGLVRLPACALTTPQRAACRTQTPLDSKNDSTTQTVSASVSLDASALTASATTTQSGLTVLAVAAAAEDDGGGNGGSYSATTLSPSGSWSQGGSSGSFTYDYPITVPAAGYGAAPDISLHYDSGAVDGKTAGTQAQSSWVGDGWSTPESFVEQSFVPCASSPEGTASPSKTYDACYNGQVLTLSLNGSTTSLVWDAAKKTWKQQSDDGSVITHVTGAGTGTGTHDDDYWKVTDRNGTVYQFGRNRLPGWATGKDVTNSVQTEPVFSAHSGDPCYDAAGFGSSVCTMAYRWNLDYVSDVHGNAMAYYYTPSTNYYGQNLGAKNVSYVRDAYLAHIDYGFVDGGAFGTVPDKIVFTTGNRCVSGTCTPLNSTNAKNWPDVPFSDICASGTTCSSYTPTFFSTVRLTGISTQQWSVASAKYVTVDSYALDQSFPATGDGGAVSPTLWLKSVQRTGSDLNAGATSSITLPAVTFTGQELANRVDKTSLPGFYRFRLATIVTETGSVITANYQLANPCASPVTLTPSTNTSSCYPVSWTPTGYSAPITDWFNKYVVGQVTQTDPTGLATTLDTRYTYKGGAAWHYDVNETVQAKYRTYGQFRGYGDVQTRTGDLANDKQTLSEQTYYRGMSKNNNSTVVNVTDSQGAAHEDLDQLTGQTLESSSYLGDGGPVDHSTITSYWVSAATATRTRTGLPDLTSNVMAPVEEFTRQAVTSGASSTWRYTETDTSYDTTAGPTLGLETVSYTHTVPAAAANDSCTSTKYAPVNTSVNLVGLDAEVETDSVACGGYTAGTPASKPGSVNTLTAPVSVARPAQVMTDIRTFYDDETFATTFPQSVAPTKGDVTMVRAASTYSGGAFTYQTSSRGTFDTHGRQLKAYDGNGNLTSTAYTDDSVGLTTGVKVTNPLSQVSSTTLDTERGLAKTATDPNSVVTTTERDALGRTTSVWLYSRAITTAANYLFSYTVSKTGISSATSQRMSNTGGYVMSITLYDALLRVRETQSNTEKGGRMVTENLYDSRGWVYQKNNGWWDAATLPNTTLVTGAISAIPSADVFTFDGMGRTLTSTSMKYGLATAKGTTIYGGDRTTVIPPTGGTIQATLVDPLGRATELDQYTSPPTVTTPANTFTGIWKVTGGATTKTAYGYDGHGNQSTVTDAAGAVWSDSYDLLGQVTSKSDPDAGAASLVYDGNGNPTQSTDSRGQSVSTTYDALNRKTGRYAATTSAQSSTNKLASWVYDNSDNAVAGMTNAIGHVTTESAYWGGAAYTTQYKNFNVFGGSLGETVSIPASTEGAALGTTYTFTHSYTPTSGLPLRDVYTAGAGLPAESILYSFDAFDQPAAVGGYGGAKYDAYGRVEQVTLNGSPNQAFITPTYDENTGNVTKQVVTSVAGSNAPVAVDEQNYGYDADQNLVKQTGIRSGSATARETQCYTYDGVQRLSAAWTATDACAAIPTTASHASVGDGLGAASAYWTTWTYNAVGERTQQVQHSLGTTADTSTTSTYNGNNAGQSHTLTGTTTTGPVASSTALSYDQAGHVTSRKAAQGDQGLVWNAAGQLISVTAGGKTSSFEYDAEGNLLIQKDPGSVILYLPHQQITLDTATGTTTGVRYQYLPGGAIAYRNGATSTTYGYQITDLQGTPFLQLDNTAQIPTWRQFTPFGDLRGARIAWADNRTFLDKTTDTTTGLTNVGARYYDPSVGDFLSLDPVLDPSSPQSLNGYAYANNNPVTFSDPTGLFVPKSDDQDAGRVQDPDVIDRGNQQKAHNTAHTPFGNYTGSNSGSNTGNAAYGRRVQAGHHTSGNNGHQAPSAAAQGFKAYLAATGHHMGDIGLGVGGVVGGYGAISAGFALAGGAVACEVASVGVLTLGCAGVAAVSAASIVTGATAVVAGANQLGDTINQVHNEANEVTQYRRKRAQQRWIIKCAVAGGRRGAAEGCELKYRSHRRGASSSCWLRIG